MVTGELESWRCGHCQLLMAHEDETELHRWVLQHRVMHLVDSYADHKPDVDGIMRQVNDIMRGLAD